VALVSIHVRVVAATHSHVSTSASNESYPNRQLEFLAFKGENITDAAHSRVCRPMMLDEEQCRNLVALVEKRANVTFQPIRWSTLFSGHHINIQRKHSAALVLGSGPSLNTLTEPQLKRLRAHMDVWVINNGWVAQWLQPDFWHTEFYCNGMSVCLDMQKTFFNASNWTANTHIICTAGCANAVDIPGIRSVAPERMLFYSRTLDPNECAKDSPNYTCTAANARYHPSARLEVTNLCCMSLMKVMDLIGRMEYSSVYLLGFDGFTSPYYYFFEDPKYYPQESIVWRSYIERNNVRKNISVPLSSNMKSFRYEGGNGGNLRQHRYEEVLASFAMYNGIRLVNLSPNSTLAQTVFTKSIPSVLRDVDRDSNLMTLRSESKVHGSKHSCDASIKASMKGVESDEKQKQHSIRLNSGPQDSGSGEKRQQPGILTLTARG